MIRQATPAEKGTVMRSFVPFLILVSAAACGSAHDRLVPGVDASELSVPSRRDGPCSATVDQNGDGAADETWTFDYSPDGLSETDTLRDVRGTLVDRQEFQVNHAGEAIRVS